MPRKQRFKPSRKPKPAEPMEATETQRSEQQGNREGKLDVAQPKSADVIDIESGRTASSPRGSAAVIDDNDGDLRGA